MGEWRGGGLYGYRAVEGLQGSECTMHPGTLSFTCYVSNVAGFCGQFDYSCVAVSKGPNFVM